MKEIEVLVSFDDSKEEVLKKLSNFKYIKDKKIYDIYYVDPLRENLKPESDLRMSEQFRIRRSDDMCLLTYKKVHFNGKRWLYSEEYETEVKDYNIIKKTIEMLGLKEMINVNNKRKVYTFENYEIVFEDVENLGLFIEVERLVDDSVKDTESIKNEIRDFVRSLNLTNAKEVNMGKNQLMYRIQHKINENKPIPGYML